MSDTASTSGDTTPLSHPKMAPATGSVTFNPSTNPLKPFAGTKSDNVEHWNTELNQLQRLGAFSEEQILYYARRSLSGDA